MRLEVKFFLYSTYQHISDVLVSINFISKSANIFFRCQIFVVIVLSFKAFLFDQKINSNIYKKKLYIEGTSNNLCLTFKKKNKIIAAFYNNHTLRHNVV